MSENCFFNFKYLTLIQDSLMDTLVAGWSGLALDDILVSSYSSFALDTIPFT